MTYVVTKAVELKLGNLRGRSVNVRRDPGVREPGAREKQAREKQDGQNEEGPHCWHDRDDQCNLKKLSPRRPRTTVTRGAGRPALGGD
ncbi:MAG TPA: hypothetical protein VER17_02260 [Tepidisphaeraceae bacterium]|nr:hypothetical protein [Tepidisphaeraceae bacterium]